ncbi:hypothetical protein CLAIMM_04502 [Cladophialophora immunda]|nr:hypothetical protein CLAIMM_04502 [Cladophialophora immunda]
MSAPLVATTTVRMKEPDADCVYFCENSCPSSYSGCLSDDEGSSMTEQEIAEYIKYSNINLYERLNGVRIPSSYVPGDDDDDPQGPRDTAGDENENGGVPAGIQEAPASLTCATDLKAQYETGSSDADCPSETDLTYPSSPGSGLAAEPIVLGRYHFTFYQHCEPGTVYCCSSPTCRNPRNEIPVGNYFGIIRDEAMIEEDDQPADYNRVAYYCLDCLDEVVDREEQLEKGQKMVPQLVDGAQPDKSLILNKALEMYPTLAEKDFFFVRVPSEEGAPEIELGAASNSKKMIRLRRQKQLEIHRIVQDLSQRRFTALYRLSERNTKVDPSGLRILGPLESQPYRERYKKQGLEWINRLEGSEVRKAWSYEGTPAMNQSSVPDLRTGDLPVCYCREPAGQEPMLHCQSASCMLGPIHFRCSGLDQLPLETEEYWCDYCIRNTTDDTEQVSGDAMVGNYTSKGENDMDETDVETEDGASGSTASGDEEEDNEIESEIAPPAHGFVAVNHVFH